MKKDLEYFKDFLANPHSYNVGDFYSMAREWGAYILAHKDEFNYLEDEEWREIRERLIDAFDEKEDLRDEFEELSDRLDAARDLTADAEKIAIYDEWLVFMKRRQWEYSFTDEQIAGSEESLNRLKQSLRECDRLEEELREAQFRHQEAIDDLAESLFEHHERTGHRPVLTALRAKKKITGN